MRRVCASAAMALLVAARPAAAQEPTIDWSRTAVAGGVTLPGEGPGGATVLQLRATASGPASFHLVTIDHPPVTAPAYVVTGQVRYQGVAGQGYLEMWTVFPDGQRFFSRTLDSRGTLAALHGESDWRPFELPFRLGGTPRAPSRLEINLVLPAGGTVWLGPIRLEQSAAAAGTGRPAWWSERSGALAGAMLGSLLGVVGGIIGVLGGRGRARRLVLALLVGMITLGGGCVLVGVAAAASAQPRHVWYPPLLVGGLSVVVGFLILAAMRRRYAMDELRKIEAMDAVRRS